MTSQGKSENWSCCYKNECVCEHHMLFKYVVDIVHTLKNQITFILAIHMQSYSFLNFFFSLLLLCMFVCVCVWYHNHHLCALSSQMSVVSNLPSMSSTSPLLHVLLLFCSPLVFCCILGRKWLLSFCPEGTAAGCSKLMVARLVSVIEEFWLKWLLVSGVSPQPVLLQAVFHWAHFLRSAVWAWTSTKSNKIKFPLQFF